MYIMHDPDNPPMVFGPFDYELFDLEILEHYTPEEALGLEAGRIRRLREYQEVLSSRMLLAEAQEHFVGSRDEVVRAYVTACNEHRGMRLRSSENADQRDIQYAAEFFGLKHPEAARPEDVVAMFVRRTLYMLAVEAMGREH